VGESPALRALLQQLALVAPTDAGVLISGESGTGKELVARYVHEHSRRTGRAMIRVSCASIPKELFESEFSGRGGGAARREGDDTRFENKSTGDREEDLRHLESF
jgi:transcriptional regulator with GAF, ATPase, and Fis domain